MSPTTTPASSWPSASEPTIATRAIVSTPMLWSTQHRAPDLDRELGGQQRHRRTPDEITGATGARQMQGAADRDGHQRIGGHQRGAMLHRLTAQGVAPVEGRLRRQHGTGGRRAGGDRHGVSMLSRCHTGRIRRPPCLPNREIPHLGLRVRGRNAPAAVAAVVAQLVADQAAAVGREDIAVFADVTGPGVSQQITILRDGPIRGPVRAGESDDGGGQEHECERSRRTGPNPARLPARTGILSRL